MQIAIALNPRFRSSWIGLAVRTAIVMMMFIVLLVLPLVSTSCHSFGSF